MNLLTMFFMGAGTLPPTNLITISIFENICRLFCCQPLLFGGVKEYHKRILSAKNKWNLIIETEDMGYQAIDTKSAKLGLGNS